MDILIGLAKEVGLEPKRVASTGGGEYHCSCPKCGGLDRFFIQPNFKMKNCTGRYACRQCGIKGDSIQFCRDILGLEWDEALSRCNAEMPQNSRIERIYLARPQSNQIIPPPIQWQERARSFVEWASSEIEKKPDIISLLEKRGLPKEAIKHYQIGYSDNPQSNYGFFQLPLSDFGLPEENKPDGTPKTIWIPRGIVIPTIEPSGAVIRVKIRRSDWNPSDKTPKYIAIRGCMGGMNLIGDREKKVIAVVESELDAYSLHDKVKDFALVVAVGTNLRNPDSFTDYLAKNKHFLLICHDNDEAGRSMLRKWENLYPHARAHSTSKGKDIGEAVQLGEDLREWLLSGLSAEFREALKNIEKSGLRGDHEFR